MDIDSDDYISLLKIITLLYADDIVILAEDPDSFQKSLNDFAKYCKKKKKKKKKKMEFRHQH